MKTSYLALAASFTAGATTVAVAQDGSGPLTSGSPSGGSPGWHVVYGSTPDPGGRAIVGPGGSVRIAAEPPVRESRDPSIVACGNSPVCGRKGGPTRSFEYRVIWDTMPGWTIAYPLDLPTQGGVWSTRFDFKEDLWVLQRNPSGVPQLFEFGPDLKLIRSFGDDVIGHQIKAHSITLDSKQNVWIADESGATVEEMSPDGKLLKTIGVKGRPGDWVPEKGQELLWEPLTIAFGPNGDMYVGEGHGNESPNPTDSTNPENVLGDARVLHFDKNGKFINQWYGNDNGQGHFSSVHGLDVDPKNGDVYIGDREEYRLVVYTGSGRFIRTIQLRNLACSVVFDPQGNLWVGSGMDGQVLKMDRNGKVLGALGNGPGQGEGYGTYPTGVFHETNYLTWDKQGNVWVGDSSVGRITEFIAPKNKK